MTTLWLERNIPYVTGSNLTDSAETNYFFGLPFIPGGIDLNNETIPVFSYHTIGD
jgi:hypothetical protein